MPTDGRLSSRSSFRENGSAEPNIRTSLDYGKKTGRVWMFGAREEIPHVSSKHPEDAEYRH